MPSSTSKPSSSVPSGIVVRAPLAPFASARGRAREQRLAAARRAPSSPAGISSRSTGANCSPRVK